MTSDSASPAPIIHATVNLTHSNEGNKEDIVSSLDLIQTQKFHFEDYKIILNKYQETGNGSKHPSYIISTIYDKDTIDYKVYKRIAGLGGLATIQVPVEQPSKDYFMMVKFGDYDGNILFVDHLGTIQSFRGGRFFITDDKRYLISPYNSDCSGLTVFDLKEDSLIYDKYCGNDHRFDQSSFYGQWFKDKSNHYYWLGNYGDTDPEGFYWIYQFSFEDKSLKLEKVRKDFLDKLDDVQWVELSKE